MNLERGDIIWFEHQGKKNRRLRHPFLVIDVFNNEATILQVTSIKYWHRQQAFHDRDIYEEDCNGDAIDIGKEDGFKRKSVVLINYDLHITDDDVYTSYGIFKNLEKLGEIIDRYYQDVRHDRPWVNKNQEA